MNFQRFSILCFCFLFSTGLFAQRFHLDQSFGLGTTTSNLSGSTRGIKDSTMYNADFSMRVQQFGIVYAPRVDLFGQKDISLSIAAPVMLGFGTSGRYHSIDNNGVKKDTVDGIKAGNLAFEIPVFADLNIGLRSAQDESGRGFGFYIGAGYMYSYTKIKTSVGKLPYDGFDPVFRAGIRMASRWETRWSIAFNIRGKTGANAQRTYGLQILKEL